MSSAGRNPSREVCTNAIRMSRDWRTRRRGQEVEPAVLLLDAAKTASISASFCTSSGSTSGRRAQRVGELADVLFESALIGEDDASRPARQRALRDGPRQRTLVRHADDQPDLTRASVPHALIDRVACFSASCDAGDGRPGRCAGRRCRCAVATLTGPDRIGPAELGAAARAGAGTVRRRRGGAPRVERLAHGELGNRARRRRLPFGSRQLRADQRSAGTADRHRRRRAGLDVVQRRGGCPRRVLGEAASAPAAARPRRRQSRSVPHRTRVRRGAGGAPRCLSST